MGTVQRARCNSPWSFFYRCMHSKLLALLHLDLADEPSLQTTYHVIPANSLADCTKAKVQAPIPTDNAS
jgi:hypothetical protein